MSAQCTPLWICPPSLLSPLAWPLSRGCKGDFPPAALHYLCEQLDLSPQALSGYPEQKRTGRAHRERIRQHLGYREFGHVREEVTAWLLPLALEHDFAHGLLDGLIKHLREEKIVRPGISTLERLVTQVREQAKDQVQNAVGAQLGEAQRQALNTLLEVPSGQTVSRLQWLKAPPPNATAKNLLEWLEKVEVCRSLGLGKSDNIEGV
jgi:hypothetical protein